jgi:hypothetical protein
VADILDTLDDLDEDFALDEEDFETSLVLVEEGELLEEDYEMSHEEAQNITDAIRSAATATWVLLTKAHQFKAYKALGYETWADYVKTEFEISSQRSYQLLDLGKAVAMIEAVTPEGTIVQITEAQARDIKRELPAITEKIADETRGKTPEEASEDVDRIIDEIREQKKADDKEAEKRAKAAEEAEQEGYQRGLEAAADALLEADRPDGMTDIADDGLVEMDVAGGGNDNLSPEDSMNLYNFFNMLSGVSSLPEPEDFINVVPKSRSAEIDRQLLEATSWLNRFQTLWELRD